MMTKPEAVPYPNWGYYQRPGNRCAVERVKTAAGTLLMGPTEVPGGQWIVQCIDPQGAHFALVAPKR